RMSCGKRDVVPPHVPPGSQVYQSLSGSYECRVVGMLPSEETPRVSSLVHDVKIADATKYFTTTTIYLSPEGNDLFSFRLPAESELISAAIEGNIVSAVDDDKGQHTIALRSRSLPQRLQIAYVRSTSTNVMRPLEALKVDSRSTSPVPHWRISSQSPLECDFDPLTEIEWRTARFSEAWRRWNRTIRDSAATSDEIDEWKKRRLQNADVAWHALADAIRDQPGERFVPANYFREVTAGGELPVFKAEVAKAGLKPTLPAGSWKYVRFGEADVVDLYFKPKGWTLDWRRPLLFAGGLLASLALFGLLWRRPEWGALSTGWMSRWPHALGAVAGIAWGLFLQPAFLGWIVAAVFVLAASPIRLGSVNGVESGKSFFGKLDRSAHKMRR
ncbi:MAG: hypothetical protein ACIALR_07465, partial [Blastopirellula sp. JB062]